jgi:hypothetical protein
MRKRKMSRSRKDYTEEFLYPDQKLRDQWKKRIPLGSIYQESEMGGESQNQQNPWQGSQDQAKGERP